MSDFNPRNCSSIPIEEIKQASERLKGKILHTPLVPLNVAGLPDTKIYLKLENLQPVGSFKIRGACNAILQTPKELLSDGIYTASAGNFAQGVAWCARDIGIDCSIVVPDNAPDTKVKAIQTLGGKVIKVPYSKWWETIMTHQYPGLQGQFYHPVADTRVIAGNGTIGLEIIEDLPEVDTVICPFGGGGLSTGIASAIKASKPGTKVYACEVETAPPLSVSLQEGKPSMLQNHKSSFVDGMGGKSVLEEMWTLASNVLDQSIVVSLQEIVDATKMILEKNHVVAEGAGAATVAAALSGKAGQGNIVCVISGGNIDTVKLQQILEGKIPD